MILGNISRWPTAPEVGAVTYIYQCHMWLSCMLLPTRYRQYYRQAVQAGRQAGLHMCATSARYGCTSCSQDFTESYVPTMAIINRVSNGS